MSSDCTVLADFDPHLILPLVPYTIRKISLRNFTGAGINHHSDNFSLSSFTTPSNFWPKLTATYAILTIKVEFYLENYSGILW